MLSKRFSEPIVISILILLTVFTRFIKLDWGNGYYFHPDENNMAASVSQLSFSNFNPHFFAYGQFPLYLSFFTAQLVYFLTHLSFSSIIPFANSIIILRIWSAIFSSIAVMFFYLIGRNIFKKKYYSYIFTLLTILNPGLIQLAHFGTTESILVMAFAANIYFAQELYKKYNFKLLFFSALITGIALASKITAIFFILPITLSLFLSKIHYLRSTIYYLLSAFIFFLIFSPYNFIAWPDFFSTVTYEMSVASGNIKVFYTNQFLNTQPYLFQFTHIFPYVSGLPVFIFGIFGFIFFILNTKYLILNTRNRNWLIILLPALVYFIYNGQLYTKWTRFMSPIFFIFPFLAVFLFDYINNKKVIFIITLISILPGLFFLNNYLQPDIRIQASNWIKNNIPANSHIFSEAGNVIDLPVNSQFKVVNFDFYSLDKNNDLVAKLAEELSKSDYLIVPSRRVFMNQNNNNFPTSQRYYQLLFSRDLGFVKVTEFAQKDNLILKSESAEETWTVFDRPTIRIYKKFENLTLNDYQTLLTL